MTLESAPEAPPPDEKPNYTADDAGIRGAAAELKETRLTTPGEPTEVTAGEDAPKDMTARQAGDELAKHRHRVEEERAAIRRAMGSDEAPEKTEEPTPARVEASEQAPDTPEASHAYQHGRQQMERVQANARQLDHVRDQLVQNFQSDFPDVDVSSQESFAASIQAMASYDPERATAAVAHIQQVSGAIETTKQALVGQQALAQQAINVWAAEQDRQFAAAHPELDAKARDVAAKAALEVLKDSGLSESEIQHQWNNGVLRSVTAPNILLNAARYRLGQQAAKRAVPKVPQVLKPGTGSAGRTVHGEQAASKRLDETGSVRDAARLYGLRRK